MTEKTHQITLTEQQLNIVGAGLGELPYKLSAPVMAEINQQLAPAPVPASVGPEANGAA